MRQACIGAGVNGRSVCVMNPLGGREAWFADSSRSTLQCTVVWTMATDASCEDRTRYSSDPQYPFEFVS